MGENVKLTTHGGAAGIVPAFDRKPEPTTTEPDKAAKPAALNSAIAALARLNIGHGVTNMAGAGIEEAIQAEANVAVGGLVNTGCTQPLDIQGHIANFSWQPTTVKIP